MKGQKEEIKVKRTRRRVYETPAETAGDKQGAAKVVDVERPAVIGAEAPYLPLSPVSDGDSADEIVRRHVIWAAGIGLVPIPLVDMAAVTALQLKMLKRLSLFYKMEFSEQLAKSAVASLASGVYAGLMAGSLTRLIPVIGFVSMAAMPALNGALTYAVGKVFIQHFSSGGTFLNFDPAKVRRYFEQQYKEGKGVSSKVRDRRGETD